MPTMTGGSDDARAPHEGRTSVDAAWDELLGESDEDEDSGQPDARPVTGSHASERRPDADDEMARLMGGETPKLPALDAESTRILVQEAASAEPSTVAPPPEPVSTLKVYSTEEPDEGAARTIGGLDAGRVAATEVPKVVVRDEPTAAPSKTVVAHEEPPKARASRPSLKVVEVAPVPARPHAADDRAARASRPVEPAPAASEPERANGLPWAWIGLGAIALGAVAYFATRDGAPPSNRDQAAVASPSEGAPHEPAQASSESSTPSGSDASGSDAGTGLGTADSGDTEGTSPPTTRKGDPREPPPGTPPEIAAVFRRLPVGPADRPPVGGIGATGIHIDHIAMGSVTQGATCRGREDDFSVSAGDRAGVCVRVVHPREKEELQVLWQKHEGSTRRSKMVVLPMHAYRTRGVLVLRSEYIGDWTVRILSSDGVELARHDFTVVP